MRIIFNFNACDITQVTFNPNDSRNSSNGIYSPSDHEISPDAAEPPDADERIEPYVDFSEYYKCIEEARKK